MAESDYGSATGGGALHTPAGDGICARVHVNAEPPVGEPPQHVPEKVERRGGDQAGLAALQRRKTTRHRTGQIGFPQGRRLARSEEWPRWQLLTRVPETQIQGGREIDHAAVMPAAAPALRGDF